MQSRWNRIINLCGYLGCHNLLLIFEKCRQFFNSFYVDSTCIESSICTIISIVLVLSSISFSRWDCWWTTFSWDIALSLVSASRKFLVLCFLSWLRKYLFEIANVGNCACSCFSFRHCDICNIFTLSFYLWLLSAFLFPFHVLNFIDI